MEYTIQCSHKIYTEKLCVVKMFLLNSKNAKRWSFYGACNNVNHFTLLLQLTLRKNVSNIMQSSRLWKKCPNHLLPYVNIPWNRIRVYKLGYKTEFIYFIFLLILFSTHENSKRIVQNIIFWICHRLFNLILITLID